MAQTRFLEKVRKGIFSGLLFLGIMGFMACNNGNDKTPLRLAISPYQDLAMIENIKNLQLEEKYSTKVDLVTLPWEEIISAIGRS